MPDEPRDGDEAIRCPRCAGIAINVTLGRGGVLKLVCAACHDTIGYSSELMRVLMKPSWMRGGGRLLAPLLAALVGSQG